MSDLSLSESETDIALQPEASPAAPSNSLAISEGPRDLLAGIMALARDPSVRVDVIERLMQMQERMEDRQAERDFAAALRAAQAQVKQVERRGFVDLTKAGEQPKPGAQRGYWFTRDQDIDDLLRSIMDEHGFSIFYDRVMREGGGLIVTATLLHVAGHSKTSSFPLPIDTGPGRNNLQALGSTDSYAHRYLKEGFFNIVRKGRDDDGVKSDKKFIPPEQAEELRQIAKEVGRQEGPFLDHLFAGAVRSFDELETGSAYLATRSTLEGIQKVQQQRKAKNA